MISELECTRILNAGEVKYSAEEVKQIRELLVALATIEYDDFVRQKSKICRTEGLMKQEHRKAA